MSTVRDILEGHMLGDGTRLDVNQMLVTLEQRAALDLPEHEFSGVIGYLPGRIVTIFQDDEGGRVADYDVTTTSELRPVSGWTQDDLVRREVHELKKKLDEVTKERATYRQMAWMYGGPLVEKPSGGPLDMPGAIWDRESKRYYLMDNTAPSAVWIDKHEVYGPHWRSLAEPAVRTAPDGFAIPEGLPVRPLRPSRRESLLGILADLVVASDAVLLEAACREAGIGFESGTPLINDATTEAQIRALLMALRGEG